MLDEVNCFRVVDESAAMVEMVEPGDACGSPGLDWFIVVIGSGGGGRGAWLIGRLS